MDKLIQFQMEQAEKKRKQQKENAKKQAEADKNHDASAWHQDAKKQVAIQEESVVPQSEKQNAVPIQEENVIPVNEVMQPKVAEHPVQESSASNKFHYVPKQARNLPVADKKSKSAGTSAPISSKAVKSANTASQAQITKNQDAVEAGKSEEVPLQKDVSSSKESVADVVPQSKYVSAKDFFAQEEEIGFVPEDMSSVRTPFEHMEHSLEQERQQLKIRENDAKKYQQRTGKLPDSYEKVEPGEKGALLKAQMSRLKDIPRVLLERMIVEFNGKPQNQTDALVAWVVCHGDETMIREVAPYLTDAQKQLVSGWEASPQVAMQKQLNVLNKRMQQMAVHLDTIELLSTYSVVDRLGFRLEQAAEPSKINYMEDSVMDALLQAEEQTRDMRYERQRQTGRRKK